MLIPQDRPAAEAGPFSLRRSFVASVRNDLGGTPQVAAQVSTLRPDLAILPQEPRAVDTAHPPERKATRSFGRSWRRFAPPAFLLLVMALTYWMGWHRHLSLEQIALHRDALKATVTAHELIAVPAFMLVYALVVALSLPVGSVLTLCGGLLFGCVVGSIASVVAATLGATLVFLVARSAMGDAMSARAAPWLDRLRSGFQEDAFSYLLFLRLVPAFPFWLVNLAPALLAVPLRTYLAGTILGIIPGTLAFTFVGAGLDRVIEHAISDHQSCIAARGAELCTFAIPASALVSKELLAALALLGAIALVPVVLKKWSRRTMRQANETAVDMLRSGSGTKVDRPGNRSQTALTDPSSLGLGEEIKADLCIIGAGAGGLSVAVAAAQLGVTVVLIEKHKMGGDCLNYGCVPSKALIAAGRRAAQMRTAGAFGIEPVQPVISPIGVRAHVHGVIDAIAPNDSAERLAGFGVRVIQAAARFIGPDTVSAGEYRIKARRFVIATGSTPATPPIPGLATVPHFTNETIFDNTDAIDHLIIVGGGPIGLELAQAYRRLGSRVTVLEAMTALAKAEPELIDVVLNRLRAEGVVLREGVRVERVEGSPEAIRVHISEGGVPEVLSGSHLLIATGRKPNIADLNLETAGVKHDARGIKVGKGLVTSNRKVFAIGDVAGGAQFTHLANYHAGIVLRRALFRWPAKVNPDLVPSVTFTDPELARVGLSEDEARQRSGGIRIYRWPYHENDRAQAERTTEGFVKVVTDRKGRIMGAAIVGAEAGELIQMWSLAISQGLNIKAMTQWISPYPTLSEINKRAAFGSYLAAAQSPLVRKVIALLAKLG
ncbi:MAG: FAD-dependent oxidoreductase [Hyphomicrobiaceae bacterium]